MADEFYVGEPINTIDIYTTNERQVHVCRPSEYSYYVFAMQYLLKQNNYYVQADGYYAIDTAKYVLKFQGDNSLEQTALVDELTWIELYRDLTLKITDKGYAVRALQYLLKAHNYYIDTDEIFGSQCYSQLVRFQTDRGLPPTGVCDDKTWNELIKE